MNDHLGCPWSLGEVENNIRSDVRGLKASPYVQKDISIIGYVLDLATDQLREVKYVEALCSLSLWKSTSPPIIFRNLIYPFLWHSTGNPSSG